MAEIQFYLLGSPRIERQGAVVKVDTRKALALLAYLAVDGNPQRRDSLATLFWPEHDQGRARAALRRTLSTLNKALDSSDLVIERDLVTLKPGREFWIDLRDFERAIAESQAHDHPAGALCPGCVQSLEAAASLYQGDFMAGFTLRDSPAFDDWQFFQAERLRRSLAGVLEALVQVHSRRQNFELAIDHARRLLALDVLREDAHRWLMKSYEWADQHSAALRQYRECVRILDKELGVSPLDETTQLYHTIQARKLPAPEPYETPPAGTAKGSPLLATPVPAAPHLEGLRYPLVGRQENLEGMTRAYQERARSGYFLLLAGEVGIGKTRLAEEFLAGVASAGAPVITARCYEGESELAYAPFVEGLRSVLSSRGLVERLSELPQQSLAEVARLLPAMREHFPGLGEPALISGPGAQTRFFESLRLVIGALLDSDPPGALFIDDLHWADRASIDLLAYLVHRLDSQPIFILATRRDERHVFDPQIGQILSRAEREGHAASMELKRLDGAEIDELVRAAAGQLPALSPDFSQRLFAETEGLPFMAVEYLQALQQEPGAGVAIEREAVSWALPGIVRNLLHARLAAAGETGGQLLGAAAVIGRSFDFDTLRQVSGRSESETLSGLEGLIAQGLIVEGLKGAEIPAIVYDFSHDKLRQVAYDNLSLARRRLLHRRAAEALIDPSRASAHAESLSGMIAQHLLAAGEGARAADFFFQAGEYARSLYAHREALAHFEAAQTVGYQDQAALYEAVGELHTLLGEYQAALASYERAAALYEARDLARIERVLGDLHTRLGDFELAGCHFEAGLDAIQADERLALKAHLLADWGWSARQKGDAQSARSLARRALDAAVKSGDPGALAQAHNTLAILALDRRDYAQAREHLQESLALSEELNDPSARVAALNNLSQMHKEIGELDRAIATAGQALSLCVRIGDRHREAALLNNLADLYHLAGDTEASMDYLKKSVVIFAEIGVAGDEMRPEIWKLTTW